ncbi:hypothetical protein J3A83DRAFT_4082858, partial [Scleroderma citrinum]
VTYTDICNGIFLPNCFKAPGPSQTTYTALRWAWKMDATPIYLLISHCANTGYHPRIWQCTVAVTLHKPNKPDYSNPRAYWLIQVEECLGKVLEHIQAQHLSY